MSQCPPALFAKLTLNGLMPDEATDRQGNCGIDAFARSLMAQMKDGRAAGPSASGRNRRILKKSGDKVALLRRVGVSWLEANASETMWPGMTVAKLCCTVSGWSFQEYLAKMRQDREWADTAFLHALGRAHGVNVVIFQAHTDETLVGEDLADSAQHEDRATISVPVALVNDHHFWGSCHAQMRLQSIPSTRVSTQRCGRMGVRAYVLTPVVVTKTPLVTPMASMMGSLQR